MAKLFQNTLYLEFCDFQEENHQYLWKACRKFRNGESTYYENIPNPHIKGNDDSKVLIKYDTIPPQALVRYGIQPKEVIERQLQSSLIKQAIGVDAAITEWYSKRIDTHGKAREYSLLWSTLVWLAPITPSKAVVLGFDGFETLYNEALKFLKQEEVTVILISGKKDNWRTVSRTLKPFKEALKQGQKLNIERVELLESIINKRNATKTSYKFKEDQQELAIQIYSDPHKPSLVQAYKMYLNKAKELIAAGTWDKTALVTEPCFTNFLKQPEITKMVALRRHGSKEWDQMYLPSTSRERASFANAKWVIDGTPWHRYFKHENSVWARLNVFLVIDEHSWAVVGYCVSFSENHEQVIQALWNACLTTGNMPWEVQYDNSSAIQSIPVQTALHRMAKYSTPTGVGNARAKVIEPIFKWIFERVVKFQTGFTGSPFASKRLDGQRNNELLASQIKGGEIVDKNTAIKEVEEALIMWNNIIMESRKASPWQQYQASMKATYEKQRKFNLTAEVDVFWEMPGDYISVKVVDTTKKSGFRTEKTFKPAEYKVTQDGLVIERKVGDVTTYYEFENTEHWAVTIGAKFSVKYNPNVMDRVYLYQNGKMVANSNGEALVLYTKDTFHSAKVDHVQGEMSRILERNAQKKTFKTTVSDNLDAILKRTESKGIAQKVSLEALYGHKEELTGEKQLAWEEAVIDTTPIKVIESPQPDNTEEMDEGLRRLNKRLGL